MSEIMTLPMMEPGPFSVGMEDPQTRKIKSIVSLMDDYRWPLLLEMVEEKLKAEYDLPLTPGDSDEKLAAVARNHIVARAIMKELKDLPGELKRKLKEVE